MTAPLLVKLGGSLITVKSRPRTVRRGRLRALAGQIAEFVGRRSHPPLVLGHGSGSFGHVAAAAAGVHRGLRDGRGLAGVTATQRAAAELHAIVLAELARAGVPVFSIAPSSCCVGAGAAGLRMAATPLLRALELGLVPVLYGDVVVHRQRGVAIASTEMVLLAAARALSRAGHLPARALWFGDAPGLLDEQGRVVPVVRAGAAGAARRLAGGSAAVDVTGGMRHRLETALLLARLGVPSLICSGVPPESVGHCLRGQADAGTRVQP